MSKTTRLFVGLSILLTGVVLLPSTALPLESFGWSVFNQAYATPIMAVFGNGQLIANGDTTPVVADDTDYGSALISSGQITHTFTISNSGTGDLSLTDVPAVELTGASAFSVVSQPSSPIATGATSPFAIRFAPISTGLLTATVAISNSDSVNNPYTFVISGTGTAATITTITSDVPDPSAVGQSYIVTVAVTSAGGTPTGTVDVDDGNGNSCVITLSGGTGSCSLTSTSTGVKTLTATYNGTTIFETSSDTEAHSVRNFDLAISKTAEQSIVGDTSTITYLVGVQNIRNLNATGVVVSDVLPPAVNYVSSATTNGSTYNPTTGVWSVGNVNANTGITLTLVVTVDLESGQVVTNIAELTTSTPVDTNDSNNSASAVISDDGQTDVYLPILLKNIVSTSDLEIVPGSLIATSTGVTLQIRNNGTGSASDAFWVDVYYNPSQTPALNKPWDTIAPAGAVWGVTKILQPGEVLTLTRGDKYYYPDLSSSKFITGVTVYAYVDSINYATTYGNVWEINENNNLSQPVISTAGRGSAVISSAEPDSLEDLPPR
ncbi:MAG: choice-of-anchor D domain-containing protein [Anaerolineae bacterium]|nr:choice-of-anchor D domain-containing protein [Anaerolineae bacterium]